MQTDGAEAAPAEEEAVSAETAKQWFDDAAAEEEQLPPPPDEPPPPEAPPPELPQDMLDRSDLENTRWNVVATPREDSWMKGGAQEQEFTLLADDSVVWGGSAGGFGTGGKWTLKDGLVEIIRKTPLGLVTGRDYYMANAGVSVNADLQFELKGIIRSYNALYPVMVIADFVATRRPGRFVRDVEEDEDEAPKSE